MVFYASETTPPFLTRDTKGDNFVIQHDFLNLYRLRYVYFYRPSGHNLESNVSYIIIYFNECKISGQVVNFVGSFVTFHSLIYT